MLDDIGYYTRFEYEVLNISHGRVIVAKRYKLSGLYILYSSNAIGHSSSVIEDFYDKNMIWELRSRNVR